MDRLVLQKKFETLLGSRNVYYDPLPNISMKYPAIVYELSDYSKLHADNITYSGFNEYKVTVISDDPDNVIWKKLVNEMNWCSYGRRYVSEDLYHDVLTLYF